jgi:hypothetical protein
MGRGFGANRPQGFDQARVEQVERARSNDPKRAERGAKTRKEGKALLQKRNELLKNFEKRDKITDGRYIARIIEIDTLRGELVVGLVPSGKEMRWSPDFVNKIP